MKVNFTTPYEKQPAEQETLRIDWTNRATNLVVSGYTLTSVGVTITDSSGINYTPTMLIGTPTIDAVNNYVYMTIGGGVSNCDYLARIICTFTKTGVVNQIQEADLKIKVKET